VRTLKGTALSPTIPPTLLAIADEVIEREGYFRPWPFAKCRLALGLSANQVTGSGRPTFRTVLLTLAVL
jgi:hypothetical protein